MIGFITKAIKCALVLACLVAPKYADHWLAEKEQEIQQNAPEKRQPFRELQKKSELFCIARGRYLTSLLVKKEDELLCKAFDWFFQWSKKKSGKELDEWVRILREKANKGSTSQHSE